MTKPEQVMRDALIQANIPASFQVPTANGFIIDFVVNDTNIAIEVDGEKWHRNRKKYDKMRDKINQKETVYRKGYQTLRFTATEVCNNPSGCIDVIKEYL